MSANITKEGVEVQVGQFWRDRNKRMKGRLVEVVGIGVRTKVGKVQIKDTTGRLRWLSVSRMHRHSTGFELVPSSVDNVPPANL